MQTENTSIIKKQSISEVVAHRDRAIECLVRAYDMMEEANKAYMRASETEHGLYFRDMPTPSHFGSQRKSAQEWAQEVVDRQVWRYLLGASGLKNLMDAQAVDEFEKQLQKQPPACTIDTINSTFSSLNETKNETFVRGLINVFNKLDSDRYKTNDAFKITPRIIMSRVLSTCGGGFNYWNKGGEAIGDLCRIMHILDGKQPKDHLGDFRSVIASAWTWSKKESTAESEYFHARLFKNGNAHITIKRLDLVEKANKLIAAHYGQTLAAA